MKITISQLKAFDDFGSSSGLMHLDPKYKQLETHPELVKHKPKSRYGECFLALLHGKENNCFCWVSPESNGTYSWNLPIFKVTYVK